MEEKDTKKNAPQGKGKGKAKKQTMNLNEFVNAGQPPAGFTTSGLRWSAVMEDEDDDSNEFGSNLQDHAIVLPTAPKAQRGPDIDIDQVPTQPPFICYMSNLPFEATEDDIQRFFKDIKITRIDLAREPGATGRMRGQGTCEFPDRQTLIDAFTYNNETIKNRPIKMSIHSFEQEREHYRRERDGDREDRTAGDWRSGPASRPMGGNFPPSNRSYQSDSNNFGNNRNYNNRNYADRSHYGDRGERNYGDRSGYGDRDRSMNDSYGGGERNSYNNRSMNRGMDRGGMDRGGYNQSNNYSNNQDRSSDYGRDYRPDEPRSDEPARERPRLNLMPPTNRRVEQQPPVEQQQQEQSYPQSGSQEHVNRRSESESSETTRRSIEPERPVERKRLVLLPPSKKENTEPAVEAAAAPAPKSSSSIFGEARPVDTTKRLLEVETKIKEKLDDVKIEQELEKFEKPPRDLNSLRGSRELTKRLSSDSGSHTSERQGDAGGDGEGGQRSGYYQHDNRGDRSSNRFNDDGNYRRSGGNRRMNNQGGRNYDNNYNNRDGNRDGYGRDRDGYNQRNKYNNNRSNNNWSNDEMDKRPQQQQQQHDYDDQHSNRMGSGGNRPARDRNEGYQTVNKFNLLKEGEMD